MRDWDRVRIGDVCALVNGRGFKPHEWAGTGYPIIRIQNLNGSSEFNYYAGEFDPKILVDPGTLLFAWSGSKGSSFGPHVWRGPQAVLNYHTWKVIPNERVERDFLLQTLHWITSQIEARTQGAAGLVHTQKGFVEAMDVVVPPLTIQRRIAEILRTWDEAIEKTERLIATKTMAFDHWSHSLLTGRRLGRKRANWPSASLTEITTEATTRNGGSGFNTDAVMGVNKAHGMIPMRDHVRASDLSRYKVVRPNAFAYNPMRLNIGSIAQNLHGRDVLVSPDYVAFEARPDALLPAYFDHLRRTPMWGRFVKTAGSGGVRVRIYYDDLADFFLELPPRDEQTRIVEVLDTGRREIAILEQQRDAIVRQKRGLMQKLLTGEWPVKVPKSQETAA
jgi:type I restriction enzyme S subunit